MGDDIPGQPDEALAWLRSRVPLSDSQWRALTQAARHRAITVAGLAQQAMVAEVQAALVRALSEGTTLADFVDQVGDSLTAAWVGSKGSPAARLETVFRTNVMSAYNAGRYAQATDPDVLTARPYWRFLATLDSRTAPQCRAAHGVILPASDPFWQTHYPPLHHRCRCVVQTLSERGAERYGGVTAPSTLPAADGFGSPPSL